LCTSDQQQKRKYLPSLVQIGPVVSEKLED
jgi:hypothetical protein